MDAGDAGRIIGDRYQCVELLGRGGMGEVWRARDTLLQRDVAVKRLAYGDGAGDEATVGRSMREARLAARLNHPNAVSIHDVIADDGLPCIVMELVSGKSLKELVAERGPLDPISAARVGRQVAAALAVAHRAGIVHRDVKPGNVLIADDGTAKLTDFGIARDEGDAGMTSTQTFIGTPNFLAPEVALGGNHSPASDVWALGATLYSAVEGEPPFSAGGNALAVLNRIATTDPPMPRRAGPLTATIGAAMRRDPAGRPPADAVEHQLGEIVDHARDRSGPAIRLDQPFMHTPPPQQSTPPPYRTPQPLTGPYTPPPVTAPPPGFTAGGPNFGPAGHYTPPPPPGPPARRSRRTLVLALCAVLVVAGAATAIVLVSRGGKHHVADPTHTPVPTESTSLPTLPTSLPTTLPTTAAPGDCSDARTNGTGPAITYVIFAELSEVDGAQACTKPGTVSESFTRSLNGKVFSPAFAGATNDQAAVVRTRFTAIDGTKIVVTCTRGDDGKYLVTDVHKE